ncbi:MAG: hypothetical protein KatS3mg110_2608 [Pirellulaceae bacterium]|nr:MAG: hypothetical protein KatS3mg110_2608 [Pirellulaceae bacterium]
MVKDRPPRARSTLSPGILIALFTMGCIRHASVCPPATMQLSYNTPSTALPASHDLSGRVAGESDRTIEPRQMHPPAGGASTGRSEPSLVRTVSAQPNEPRRPEPGESAEAGILELDLAEALALAGGQSPQIAFAAARYREAYARLQAAKTLWLPSLRAGMSYHHHDGQLQASDGKVINVNRSSLQAGLGMSAVGAGTSVLPGVAAQFQMADASFQPRIAAQAASAASHASDAVAQDTLLAVAVAYLDLLRARQLEVVAEKTLRNAEVLAELTAQFAQTGQGSQADADRARTELTRRQNELARAQEAVKVASARLAELLSVDPQVSISPEEPTLVPIDLVAVDKPMQQLVATALSNRPELAEARHLVQEAVLRYRRERLGPWLPSVILGISQSGFGGGIGSTVANTGGRFDFDAAVFWGIRNLGFGDRARQDESQARWDQAVFLQARRMDQVAREVVEAATQVKARKDQIRTAESGVQAALDSYQRNMARVRGGQGLPIELLQSLQALDEAQRDYVRALYDYNEAQFRLQRALGWPVGLEEF